MAPIIPRTASSWQGELARAIRDPRELLEQLGLASDDLAARLKAGDGFSVLVPHAYLAKMQPGDKHDPLLLQVLPAAQELVAQNGFLLDPVGDLEAMPLAGVLHKYHGRALLITTGSCAIHCRYCFRRHFPYQHGIGRREQWQPALDYLHQDPEIHEIILSGGDPLTWSNQRLQELIDQLALIPHLKRLRIHTRLPLVLPSRIDEALCKLIEASRFATVMVIHANHANELDHSTRSALTQIKNAGVTLLNQSVLLRGINDTLEALSDLSEQLFEAGVLPYYLHLLDRAQGTAHFEVDREDAVKLHRKLAERLPGYLLPRLVYEASGAMSKLPADT